MKIEYVDGTLTARNENLIYYFDCNRRHYILGCYVHKNCSKDCSLIFNFRESKKEYTDNTIYIVRQKNKLNQFRTLVHELAHFVVCSLGNNPKLHSLIDKYL